MVKKKIEYLIIDTSAFIKNAQLQEIGENLITAPEVVREIKNKRQLRRLAVLPYDLIIKETFPEHVKFVTDFSMKTGDYPCLSATDIKVIALTYQLEKEKIGIYHLNKVPTQKVMIKCGGLPPDSKNIAGFYMPTKGENSKSTKKNNILSKKCDNENNKDSDDFKDSVETDLKHDNSDSSIYDSAEEGEFNEPEGEHTVKNIVVTDNYNNDDDDDNGGVDCSDVFHENINIKTDEDYYGTDSFEDESDEDDDDKGWINPGNIKEIKNTMSQDVTEDSEGITVACLTTDFAMQNVLKQIGLNVVTLEGKLIKELRTFILRCYGCLNTTSIMTSVFCPKCGNQTLKRVAVSLDADGTQKLHINFRKPLTARGKKYSVPLFKGGKHSSNPVLSADQPMPQQFTSKKSRMKNNPLDDEYVAGFSPFVMRDVNSKSAVLGLRPQSESMKWLRRNPNEARPRGRKNKRNL